MKEKRSKLTGIENTRRSYANENDDEDKDEDGRGRDWARENEMQNLSNKRGNPIEAF